MKRSHRAWKCIAGLLWAVCRRSSGGTSGVSTCQTFPHVQLPRQQSLRFHRRDGVWSGWRVVRYHMLKLSPQPHVPLMLGLLKTNSLDSFDSTKSISVPRRVSWAFFSINTLTPGKQTNKQKNRTVTTACFNLKGPYSTSLGCNCWGLVGDAEAGGLAAWTFNSVQEICTTNFLSK